MHFSITEGLRDTDISDAHEMTFEEFIELFGANHVETSKKDSWMFAPWKFLDPNGGRNANNTEGTDVICLDFDDGSGWSVETAKAAFSKYTHFGYTSFSHQKRGNDRFRIVLPLKSFASVADIKSRRDDILIKYKGVDKTTLSISRSFYIPLCETENLPLAQRWSNIGELFDVFEFEEAKPVKYEYVANEQLTDNKRQWILDSLASCGRVEDAEWRKIGLSMCASGYDLNDFVYVSSGLKPSKKKKDCSSKWKEIAKKTNEGNVRLSIGVVINFLKEQGKTYTEDYEPDDEEGYKSIVDFVRQKKSLKPQNSSLRFREELFGKLFGHAPVAPFNREKRAQLTKNLCLLSQKDIRRLNADRMLLYAFEGYGKSYYAMMEVARGNKVIFASVSNAQAEEQYNSFLKADPSLNCQLIVGREFNLRRKYEIEAVKRGDAHPWDYGSINKSATLKLIAEKRHLASAEEALSIWDECGADSPNWDEYKIIFTTFARTLAWGKMMENASYLERSKNEYGSDVLSIREPYVPDGTVVFFDDPQAIFFNPLKPYNEKYEHLVRKPVEEGAGIVDKKIVAGPIIAGSEIRSIGDDGLIETRILHEIEESAKEVWVKTSEINKDQPASPFELKLEVVENGGRKYFVRPNELKFGYGLRNCRLVFTTTEIVTALLISRQYPDIYIPKLMPDGQMRAGEIVMIKSNLVRSKTHGLLPPIINRIKKNHDIEFIGDGVGAEFNTVNSKGMNSFKDVDTIIKCSAPNPNEMFPILDGLGFEDINKNRLYLSRLIALDKLQQAIGRNCGYRATDKKAGETSRKAIVLCDANLFKKFTDRKNPMMRYWIDDKNIIEEPKRVVGIEEKPLGLVQEVCWFSAYYLKYLKSGIGNRGQAFEDDYKDLVKRIKGELRPSFKRSLFKGLDTLINETRDSDPMLSKKLSALVIEWGG